MARVLILVEGETEETFVKELLAPHLSMRGHVAEARLMGNARLRARRGGIRPWPSTRADILRHLGSDAGIRVSTMVDYYALPASGDGAWPGRAAAAPLAFASKAPTMVAALASDVAFSMGRNFDPRRFVPYVMMHEFEALLFSDCERFARGIGQPELAARFEKVLQSFASPEEINDSPLTAPSKRVIEIVPTYQKPFHGNVAALEIGLDAMRAACPTFDDWVTSLERIV